MNLKEIGPESIFFTKLVRLYDVGDIVENSTITRIT